FGGPAGTNNIIMRASRYRQGGKVSYAVSNRAYSGRLMGSYHTGLSEEGWAMSVSLARRYSEESYVEGTLYDANSFFLSVEKKFSEQHSLNLTAFYTPNRRGKTSPNTEEVYELKGNRYNSYWGYQNGEIRNSRVKRVEEPVVMLNHFWKLSEKAELNTNLAYQFGRVGDSRIDYGGSRLFTGENGEEIFIGGGSNPDPAYYQKLPSYFLRFENDPDYRSAYLAQQEFLVDGQVNWPAMYLANQTSVAAGGNALYVLYEDRSEDKQVSANTILNWQVNSRLALNSAVSFRYLNSENFARVLDLLGGNVFLDVDSFSEGDAAQNNLVEPNSLVSKNDIFKYHYELNAIEAEAFLQAQLFLKKWDLYAAAEVSYSEYQRNGFFKNGNFPDNSLGKSNPPDFVAPGLKTGATYKLSGKHLFNLNLAAFAEAPTLRNSFSNARQNNELVQGLETQKVLTGDFGYIFRGRRLRGRITGFYGLFQDASEISFYYADGLSGLGRNSTTAFVQEVLTGIEKQHTGVEIGLEAPITGTLKLKAAASVGEYIYTNAPRLYLTSDDFSEAKQMGTAQLKNYRIAGGPQQAAQLGFEYRDPDYWWFSATANYFAKAFVDIAPLLRTSNFLTDSDGLPIVTYNPEVAKALLQQEELDDYILVNLVGGKSWRIKNKYVGFFASLNNVLGESYRTGGFEQSRNANYLLLKEDMEREQPLFSPKYWFGPGTTYYAHLYFRF
ncbi:MAG: TonB-dependent receptor, partial [Salinimicrobium sp.]